MPTTFLEWTHSLMSVMFVTSVRCSYAPCCASSIAQLADSCETTTSLLVDFLVIQYLIGSHTPTVAMLLLCCC